MGCHDLGVLSEVLHHEFVSSAFLIAHVHIICSSQIRDDLFRLVGARTRMDFMPAEIQNALDRRDGYQDGD